MEDEQGKRALTVPFEVKTGRNTTNTSHRAQTALYTLLLSDRYGKLLQCFSAPALLMLDRFGCHLRRIILP